MKNALSFSRRNFLKQGMVGLWVVLNGAAQRRDIPIDALFGKDGSPKESVREIFLMECPVAGTTHVKNIRALEKHIEAGDLLPFKREPDNKYDNLAILILNRNQKKIGYVPRRKNEVLAHLMDAGKVLFGKVESKNWEGDWLQIHIRVFMGESI